MAVKASNLHAVTNQAAKQTLAALVTSTDVTAKKQQNAQLKYIAGYSANTIEQVKDLIATDTLKSAILKHYPVVHDIRTDKALYDYTMVFKQQYLKQSAPISKVIFDEKITLSHQALGLHTYANRTQGNKVKAKNEIRISSRLRHVPEPLLRMVVVHELAHLKEKDHNKAFYQLCEYMTSDYHQLEFDLRLLLTCIELGKSPY
ncbi:M48 metallopeptidase family protein [Shewanella donghaensis]|uniref:M48 metallopeptidase family protein n=1 Tax=Shewanella donghaensis TaxID=238836 RepID=UPI001183CBE0|nr:M48 family metallopeptidase [Shewanella donghaensis]